MFENKDSAQKEAQMLRKVLTVTDPYLSCDECFELVDSAVDGLLDSGEPFSTAFKNHLLACPACHEEAVSLAELTALEKGLGEEVGATKLLSELR